MSIAVHCKHDRLVEPAALKPNPRNPNHHSEEQLRVLAAAIRSQGWRRAAVVSAQTGLLVTGHSLREASLKHGLGPVPVDVQSFASPEQELAHLVADNRIPELAWADPTLLNALVAEVVAAGHDVEITGFDEANFQRIAAEAAAELRAAAPEPAPSDDGNPYAPEPLPGGRVIVTYANEEEKARLWATLKLPAEHRSFVFAFGELGL